MNNGIKPWLTPTGWIAEPLNMGSAGYAANCLRDVMGKGKHANLRDPFMP